MLDGPLSLEVLEAPCFDRALSFALDALKHLQHLLNPSLMFLHRPCSMRCTPRSTHNPTPDVYINYSPYATWALTASDASNPGINRSAVTAIKFEFELQGSRATRFSGAPIFFVDDGNGTRHDSEAPAEQAGVGEWHRPAAYGVKLSPIRLCPSRSRGA